ncbi:MAG: hypothetical protein R6T96_01490, partial [Longimicrobiales bacterium]
SKPFFAEEFYCRLNNTIETIEFIQKIEELSNKDYLTDPTEDTLLSCRFVPLVGTEGWETPESWG